MRARHLAIIVLMFTTSKGFPQVSGDVPNANRINAYGTYLLMERESLKK